MLKQTKYKYCAMYTLDASRALTLEIKKLRNGLDEPKNSHHI